MRSLSTAATALAFLCCALPASSAEPPALTNPTQIVNEIVLENVAALVTELGGQQVEIVGAEGKKGIVFRDGNVPFILTATGCANSGGNCVGLSMIVVVDNSKTGYTLETLDGANRDSGFLSFFREGTDKFIAGRITIVDGGVTKRNLGNEIALFAALFGEAMKKMANQTVASVDRPNPYLSAFVGRAEPQAIVVSPAYAARLTESLSAFYGKKTPIDLRRH